MSLSQPGLVPCCPVLALSCLDCQNQAKIARLAL